MPYRHPDPESLIEKPVFGKGECVDLIKATVPGLIGISTRSWREGENVLASKTIKRGTAIATFINGKFPHADTGQHAAIFLSKSGSTIWVIEQWRGLKQVQKRRISFPVHAERRADGSYPNASNNAFAFSVIE
ncbi:MAG: BPSL0067 family protein [Gammaproteobacteria bacterium]